MEGVRLRLGSGRSTRSLALGGLGHRTGALSGRRSARYRRRVATDADRTRCANRARFGRVSGCVATGGKGAANPFRSVRLVDSGFIRPAPSSPLIARATMEKSHERAAERAPIAERIGRLLLAASIGVACGYFTFVSARPDFVTTDYEYLWRAARLWSSGVDPYAIKPRAAWLHLWPLFDPLFYPMPAVLFAGLFAGWSLAISQVVFVSLASAFLAWRLTRRALWPLLIFMTPSFWMAAFLGQWSPWLTLAALVPNAGFLLVCKPTIGLACFSYRPTWRGGGKRRAHGGVLVGSHALVAAGVAEQPALGTTPSAGDPHPRRMAIGARCVALETA